MRYLLGLLMAMCCLWLLTGVHIVQSHERAVVRRFGRPLEHTVGPGLHIGLPWGIDRVDRVSIKDRSVRIGYDAEAEESFDQTPPGQLLSGDHNLVNLQVVLDYAVPEDKILDFVLNGARAEVLIMRAAESALAEWVAQRDVDDVMLQGKGQLPIQLVERTQELLADYNLGVVVKSASVKPPFPPAELKSAFENVARAHESVETLKKQAETERDQLQSKGAAQRFRIENEAKVYRRDQILQAEADAKNFDGRLVQFRRLSKDNPNYLTALWWEEMSRLYGRMREGGRIDVLDNRIGAEGLDITQFPTMPKKK